MANMRVFVLIAILISSFIVPAPIRVQAATLPEGFQESVVFSGLTNPTKVEFSPDGRVFVAEKSGLIKVFESLTDTTPTVFADLRTNTHNFWDRGLLGMALDPNFPANPYVYVLYTHDAAIGGTAPRWGTAGVTSDGCPNPPGATTDGCLVSGRLSRLAADGNAMTGPEQVLIEDWCQQFPGHSIGDLAFGGDGALYVSAGDGANFNNIDYGQYGGINSGFQTNPCGDPPGGVGGSMMPPTAEGGALRAQSLRRAAGSAVNLNGSVLRVNPATGLAMPDNPLAANSNVNARRIIAYGLRNPFRIVARPGTNEIWVGEVGWNVWEEIDRIPDPSDSVVENFGWPCYEGIDRQAGYDGANLNICENLYAEGSSAITMPYFKYNPYEKVVSSDTCPVGSVSIAGLAFQSDSGTSYPAAYHNALFFADYSRGCIWVMFEGTNGQPDPSNVLQFVDGAASPVDLEIGPDGNLYYVDFDGGTIRRIEYFGANQPPFAVATADPTNGSAPLQVNFNGTGSSDPNPADTLSYAWDLDGDGEYDDSSVLQPSLLYPEGTYTVRLQVTDNHGASDISDAITISSGNTAPAPTMNSPVVGTKWQVDSLINFSGSATDVEEGSLPASAFMWTLVMHHCPSNCHSHPIQTFSGVTSGSFTAPDHEYPSHLELQLTVTDSGGLSTTISRQLNPQTVTLNFKSNPSGLQININATTQSTPFNRTVIVGSNNTVSAISPQTSGSTYYFQSWSDGGTQTHSITAPATATTYTAKFGTTLGGFPTTSLLDSFNRADGPIGSNWSGFTSAFNILSNELDVATGGWDTYILWNNASFGTDQEAFLTFKQMDSTAENEHVLILKSQSTTSSSSGGLYIIYDHATNMIQMWTYHPSQDWVQHGVDIPVTFEAGDQFGARARSDGTVAVYQNGNLLGAGNITDWPFYASSGYIGFWFANADAARLDDFGGGDFVAGPTPAAPTAFGKTSPLKSALKQSSSPTLKWDASKRATSYQYCIDTVNNSSCDTAWIPVSVTSASLGNLVNSTTYYWQVRAINLGGTVEADSGTWWKFKTRYAAPMLVTPNAGEDALALRPSFDWEDESDTGVTGYIIQIAKNDSFTQLILTGSPVKSSYVPTINLPKNMTLYWRVRTQGANGPSVYSPSRSFDTPVNPPATPSLVSPAADALMRDYTPSFSWKPVTGAQTYVIQVDNNVSFNSPEINDNSSATAAFTPATDLNSNTKYYWRVRAVNNAGELSNWSAVLYFWTSVLPPVPLAPADDSLAVSRKPLLDWQNVPDNTGYTLQLWKTGTTPVLVKTVSLTKNSSQYQFTTNLPANTGYYWKVRTLAIHGPSSWSAPFDFVTGP